MPTLDNIHKIDAPFWARPGFATFAKKDDGDGGGKDDDDQDDDDEDDEDEEDDDLAELSDDELRAELRKTRESLSKASGSSKTKRDRIKALKAELETVKSGKPAAKKAADGDDDKPDIEAIREAARLEGQKAGEVTVKRAKVETALAAAGVADSKAITRLARMVDLDDLDLDNKGNLDGLDEVIDELKADMPSLFQARRKRSSIAGDADQGGDGKRRDKEASKLSASEQQARLAKRER